MRECKDYWISVLQLPFQQSEMCNLKLINLIYLINNYLINLLTEHAPSLEKSA